MTPDPAMAVEQVDREAYFDLHLHTRSLSPDDYRAVDFRRKLDRGDYDSWAGVQAFARHRLAATRDIAMPEGVDRLRCNLGAETDEPSLGEMVLNYYRQHYEIGEAFNLRDRYFAALPAVRSGWRGIESAPRDGTEIDLWSVFDNGGTKTGERLVNCRWREESTTYETGWHDCFGNKIEWSGDDGCSRYVTHWQPLPAAPTDAEDGRS